MAKLFNSFKVAGITRGICPNASKNGATLSALYPLRMITQDNYKHEPYQKMAGNAPGTGFGISANRTTGQ
jgi:hypothetical protein